MNEAERGKRVEKRDVDLVEAWRAHGLACVWHADGSRFPQKAEFYSLVLFGERENLRKGNGFRL